MSQQPERPSVTIQCAPPPLGRIRVVAVKSDPHVFSLSCLCPQWYPSCPLRSPDPVRVYGDRDREGGVGPETEDTRHRRAEVDAHPAVGVGAERQAVVDD